MSRYLPKKEDASFVFEAAERWRDTCLMQDESMLGGKNVWSAKNLNADFMKEFADVVMLVEAPGNNFLEKLTFQLKEIKATPDTYQLIAEALWVMYLPCGPSFIRPHAKKDTIKKLWEIPRAESSAKFLDEKYLRNEYMGGFAHPGTAFGLNIWAELLTFLLFALTVKNWDSKEQADYLKNDDGTKIARLWDEWPRQWEERIPSLPAKKTKNRQIRHMMLYLLFPDYFERAFSGSGKKRIVRAFTNRRPRDMAWSEIDDTIRSVRAEQEKSFGTAEIDFFAPPLSREWKNRMQHIRDQRKGAKQGGGAAPVIPSRKDLPDIPLNRIFYGPPGTGKTYHTVNATLEILDSKFYQENRGKRSALKTRFNDLKKEKRVGMVTFHQSFGYEEFVEGIRPMLEEDEHATVEYELKTGIFKDMCEQAQSIEPSVQFDEAIEELKEECTDNPIELLTVSGKSFTIEYRGGKTFRYKTASALHPEKDHPVNIENIKHVYRGADPDDFYASTYILPIVNYVKENYELDETEGSDEPNLPHVLIIDEINRGNISRIFGELITLIEESKRLGEEEETTVKLPYSLKEFGVPSNLYIIGTMNTADRSIALLDTALRRRFRFVEMMPDASVVKDKADNPIVIEGVQIQTLLAKMNERIEALYDRDHQIGHSFFLRLKGSQSIETLADIFEYEILPLLQEYFYDDWEKINLVLNNNGFLSYKKASEIMGKAVDREQKIWSIEKNALRDPANYQKIYANAAADDNSA